MKYFVYEISFNVFINSTQKEALNALNKHLPGQIIVNTSIPLSNKFALGEEIKDKLEVESESQFDVTTLNIAITMANADLGLDIIKSIALTGTNIIEGSAEGILTDLVDLSIIKN